MQQNRQKIQYSQHGLISINCYYTHYRKYSNYSQYSQFSQYNHYSLYSQYSQFNQYSPYNQSNTAKTANTIYTTKKPEKVMELVGGGSVFNGANFHGSMASPYMQHCFPAFPPLILSVPPFCVYLPPSPLAADVSLEAVTQGLAIAD